MNITNLLFYTLYLGHYQTSFDTQKGRTALPSTFRKAVGKNAVITKGYEGSLIVVAQKDWEKVVGQFTNQSFLSSFARQTDRFLLGNAFEIGFDAQGRFVIPPKLREYASLGKEIIFVGVGSHIEVWDPAKWDKNQSHLEKNIDKISQQLETNQRSELKK